ncbi:MAG TPA: tyrosine recombinase [Acidimicrobiales bacterium]|nr:tyrosine recombinase [Acidimicrobiales bacterium]
MTAEPLEEYLQWLAVERGRSRATLEAYRRDLRRLADWAAEAERDPLALTPEELERYANALRSTQAAASVARALTAIRGWYGFLVDERVLGEDPTARLAPAHRGRSLPKPLSEEVVSAIIDAVVAEGPLDRRDRALLETLYGTGARVSEVCGIDLADIDLDEEVVRVTGKGNKQRLVPIGRSLRRALDAYLAPGGRGALVRARRTDRLFVNARGEPLSRQGVDLVVRRRALAAEVPSRGVSAHAFRHSCATHMLAHGADVRTVQELLGHASIATTQVYTAVAITTLQREYRDAHPRAHD